MRNIIIILLSSVFLIGCATRKERAVSHLNKALKLDSTVLKNVIVPIKIDTTIFRDKVLEIDTTIDLEESHESVAITEEEFNLMIDSIESLKEQVTLFETEKLKLTLSKTSDGLIDIRGLLKSRSISYKDTIPYIDTIRFEIEKDVDSVAPVTEIVYKKDFFHHVGVVTVYLLGILSVIATIYYIFNKNIFKK